MPIDHKIKIDHKIMRQCLKVCREDMVKSGFSAGKHKFDAVCQKRANKMYWDTVNPA